MKTPSKRGIQKTAEVTGDIIGNKTVDKMTSVRKRLLKSYKMTKWKHQKRKISPNEMQQINEVLKLV